jgi:hypothetical protein
MAIVTRTTLKKMLEEADTTKRAHIIGRALVALFDRQTDAEQQRNDTEVLNDIGFAGSDAKAGSLTAKYFLKHRTLLDWQVEKWMKPTKNGYPRICRYARQLNEVAEYKNARKTEQQS